MHQPRSFARDRSPLGVLVIVTALVTSGLGAGVARAQEGREEGRLAVVRAESALVRSSNSDALYPMGRLKKGAVVRVVEEKGRWARVATEGPAFGGWTAFLKQETADGQKLRLAADGRRGRTLDRLKVFGANMSDDYRPLSSWKTIMYLAADTEVEILETIADQGGTWYRIPIPRQASGFVVADSLAPASAADAARFRAALRPAVREPAGRTAGEVLPRTEPAVTPVRRPADPAATARGATGPMPAGARLDQDPGQVVPIPGAAPSIPPRPHSQPGGAGATSTTETPAAATTAPPATPEPPATTSPPLTMGEETGRTATGPAVEPEKGAAPPAAIPAPPRRVAATRLESLESAYRTLRDEPIASAEVLPLRDLYLQLAREARADDAAVARYAAARGEQLTIWADLQKRREDLGRLRDELSLNETESQALKRAMETSGGYAAVGRMGRSAIFDGRRLPALFRVQDAGTGRTIVYLRPTPDLDLGAMVGELVGIVGPRSFDARLQVQVIEPQRIDLIGSGAAASAAPMR